MSKRRRLIFTEGTFLFVTMILVGGMAWGGGIKLRVSAEQANIREKPDIMSAILKQLPEGTPLEAERKEGEWYAVLVEREEGGLVLGYVHESLVIALEAPHPEPPPQKEPAEEKQPPPVPTQASAAPAGMEKRERIGVVFWLGGRHSTVGDLNDGAKGLASYYEDRLSAEMSGAVEELHSSFLAGLEVRVPLAPRLYFSLGAEYSSRDNSSSVSYNGTSPEASYFTEPSFKIIPVSLALIVYPLRFVYVKAGLDYTSARCAYLYRLSTAESDGQNELWQEWKGEATSSGLGYQIGLGFEWSLGSRFSLVAEGTYRYSRFDSFEGEGNYQESTGDPTRVEGTLYRFRASAGGRQAYPLVFVRNEEPTEAGVRDVRGAELDLTGYSLRLGLKVSF